MKKYVLLIANRRTPCDNRYWVTRTTLEDAQKLAREYERNNEKLVEIYEITTDLRYE
jgi:hypothetical protein